MIRPESKLPAQQIGAELLREHDYSQQLSMGHTVSTFWLAKSTAGKCNYMLLTFLVQLG